MSVGAPAAGGATVTVTLAAALLTSTMGASAGTQGRERLEQPSRAAALPTRTIGSCASRRLRERGEQLGEAMKSVAAERENETSRGCEREWNQSRLREGMTSVAVDRWCVYRRTDA